MFWNKKNKTKQENTDKRPQSQSCVGREGQRPLGSNCSSSDKIRAEALAHARAARENLGEETIQKITEIMKNMESQPIRKAQKQLENVDSGRMLDELRWMLDNKDK
ncbi:MAG: hypothetical protein ACRBCT_09640 [Alphaproteobacteria bacterium]